ncbi:hypothetical protein ACHAXT_012921 [Thalassiosira profunda]
MAGAVFYTKKAKAKMRARKRRKVRADDGGAEDGDVHNDREGASSTSAAAAASNDGGGGGGGGDDAGKGGNRKRAANQISDGHKRQFDDGDGRSHDGHKHKKAKANQTPTTISVPADLTSKEAKKFRKDARRRARAAGQNEQALKFIVEGQAEQLTESKEGETDDGKRAKKKPKREFPCINDLLSQAASQKKLEEKLATHKAANDALSVAEKQRYIAIDCEMVGIGSDGRKSALARASAVDWNGEVLLDTFVRVPERVTDFRTRVSGVRAKNIKHEGAMEPEEARMAVGKLLLGKVLVGHALKNDLSALMLTHPREDIRDTARYKPFMRPSGRGGGKLRPRKLRDLVFENVGRRIQVEGESHCSVDDARASMELFQSVRGRWERELEGKKGGSRGKK